MVLVLAVTASAVAAAEVAWPKAPAGDLAVFATVLRFRIPAEHCSAQIPSLKPEFEGLMEDLKRRIERLARGLLASGKFQGTHDRPVPAPILAALEDSFDDVKHNFERQDAASVCPKTLQQFGEVGDESLASSLAANLTAIENMVNQMEKARDRAASVP